MPNLLKNTCETIHKNNWMASSITTTLDFTPFLKIFLFFLKISYYSEQKKSDTRFHKGNLSSLRNLFPQLPEELKEKLEASLVKKEKETRITLEHGHGMAGLKTLPSSVGILGLSTLKERIPLVLTFQGLSWCYTRNSWVQCTTSRPPIHLNQMCFSSQEKVGHFLDKIDKMKCAYCYNTHLI